MYRGHDNWGHNSNDSYASGGGSGNDSEYHKSDSGYNAGGPEEKGGGVGYHAAGEENKDEEKKDDWGSELDQAVENETSNEKEEDQEDEFAKISKSITPQQASMEDTKVAHKKNKSSIEESIAKAIEQEKDVIHLD